MGNFIAGKTNAGVDSNTKNDLEKNEEPDKLIKRVSFGLSILRSGCNWGDNDRNTKNIIASIPENIEQVSPAVEGSSEVQALQVTEGLQPLAECSVLYLQHCRRAHCIDEMLPYESRDRYQILDDSGERIFYAVSTSDCWRWNLSGARPFMTRILNCNGSAVMTIVKTWNFSLLCWGGECLGNEVKAYQGENVNTTGTYMGNVKQKFSLWRPVYAVYSAKGEELYNLVGPAVVWLPFFMLQFFGPFKLMKPNKKGKFVHEVGAMKELPRGLGPQNISNALELPIATEADSITVETKALLLALLFMTFLMYYEKSDVVPGVIKVNILRKSRLSDRVRMSNPDIPGKWYGCKVLFIFLGIVAIITILISVFP